MLDFIGHFILGGLVVSLTTYFGSKGQGFVAAFISMFPSMSVLTFFLLYHAGGKASVLGYAKSLGYAVPAWLLYVCAVALLCDRVGISVSLTVGVTLYLIGSACLNLLR